jgi:hypothetical protein
MPTRRSKHRRSQRGGGWGYTGAIASSAGAPLEDRIANDGCTPPARVVPQMGGYRQRGGGCGCMRMDPSTQKGGNYSVNVGSNDLGKVPIYAPGSCQRGGMAPLDYSLVGQGARVSENEIPVYTAGYSSINPVELPDGARYMNVAGYAKGGRRTRTKRKSHRIR